MGEHYVDGRNAAEALQCKGSLSAKFVESWWKGCGWLLQGGEKRSTYISPFAICKGFARGFLGLGRGLPFGLVGIGLEVADRGRHLQILLHFSACG